MKQTNEQIQQLIKELTEINQESIDLNQRYFNTLGFTSNIIWRLKEILKDRNQSPKVLEYLKKELK